MAFPKAKRFDYKYSLTPAPTAYDVAPVSLNSSFSFTQSKRFDPEAAKNLALAKSGRLSMSSTIFTRNPPKHNCLTSHQRDAFKEPFSRTSTSRKSTKIPQKVQKPEPSEYDRLQEKANVFNRRSSKEEMKLIVEDIRRELENCQLFLKNEESKAEFSVEDLNLNENQKSLTDVSSAGTYSVSNPENIDRMLIEAHRSSLDNKKNLTEKNAMVNKYHRSLADFTETDCQPIHIDISFPPRDIHKEFRSLTDLIEAENTKYFSPNEQLKNTKPKFTSSSDYIESDRDLFTSEEDFNATTHSGNIFKNAEDFKNSSAATFDISEEFLYDDYQSLVEDDDMEMTMNLGNYEFSEVYKQFIKLYYNGSPMVLKPDARIEPDVLEKTIENLKEDENKENLPESVPINTVIQKKHVKTNIASSRSKNKQNTPKIKESQAINITAQQKAQKIKQPCPVESQKPKSKKLVKRKPTKTKPKNMVKNVTANHNQTDDQKIDPYDDEIQKIVQNAIKELEAHFKKEINDKMNVKIRTMMKEMLKCNVTADIQIESSCELTAKSLVKKLKSVIRNK